MEFVVHIDISEPRGQREDRLFRLVDTCYAPLLQLLGKVPDLRIQLSVSGHLLEWLLANAPEIVGELAVLSQTSSLRLLQRLFYDPDTRLTRDEELTTHLAASKDFFDRHRFQTLPILHIRPEWESRLHSLDIAELQLLNFSPTSSVQLVFPIKERCKEFIVFDSRVTSEREALEFHYFPLRSTDDLLTLQRNLGSFSAQAQESRYAAGYFAAVENTTFANASGSFPAFQQVQSRVKDLSNELLEAPHWIATHEHFAVNQAKQKNAQLLFAAAQSDAFDERRYPFDDGYVSRRKTFFRALLSAQVELDVIRHPDVDPTEGWVHVHQEQGESGPSVICLDTQLLRLYLNASRGGAIEELHYKPRKLNLAADSQSAVHCLSSNDFLVDFGTAHPKTKDFFSAQAELSPAKLTVTRNTVGLASVRIDKPVTLGRYRGNLQRELVVHSGLGAHLPNATTGFSVEYWLDGATTPSETVYHCLQWNLKLTSVNRDTVSLRPLQSVGGMSETALAAHDPAVIRYEIVEGGLHGVRLIDGVDSFIMDLRSAKPIQAIVYQPLVGSIGSGPNKFSIEEGLSITFFRQASALLGEGKSNTVFLSIM